MYVGEAVQIVRRFFASLLLWQFLAEPVLGKVPVELINPLWFALAARFLIFSKVHPRLN